MESESARCLNIIQPVVSLNVKEPNLPNILSLCPLPDSSKSTIITFVNLTSNKEPPPPPPFPSRKKAITKEQKQKKKQLQKKTTKKQENNKKPDWMG